MVGFCKWTLSSLSPLIRAGVSSRLASTHGLHGFSMRQGKCKRTLPIRVIPFPQFDVLTAACHTIPQKPLRKRRSMTFAPPSDSEPNRRRNRVLIAVGLIILIVGAAVLSIFFVRPLVHWKSAQSWPSADAQILSSEIEISRVKNSTSYEAKFDYAFDVDGQEWHGHQYGFFVFSGSEEASEELVNRYPVGTEHQVFYNPSQPSDAVMDRSLGPAVWFCIGPITMTIIGSVILWLGFRGRIAIPDVQETGPTA